MVKRRSSKLRCRTKTGIVKARKKSGGCPKRTRLKRAIKNVGAKKTTRKCVHGKLKSPKGRRVCKKK